MLLTGISNSQKLNQPNKPAQKFGISLQTSNIPDFNVSRVPRFILDLFIRAYQMVFHWLDAFFSDIFHQICSNYENKFRFSECLIIWLVYSFSAVASTPTPIKRDCLVT